MEPGNRPSPARKPEGRAAVLRVAGRLALVLPTTALLLGAAQAAIPAPTAHVRGDVVSWTTGKPVAGAHISLPAYGIRTTSGPDGTFAFTQALGTDQPYRRIEAVVTAPGFGRWTLTGAPLVAGDTLQLHAELRSGPWTHRFLTREESDAVPQVPVAPDAYTSTCTGWKYSLTPPQTIKVWITLEGVSKQYDFDFYVAHVLPKEWITSWDSDSLGAGAIAVKTYGWYRAQVSHAFSGGDDCADVQDSTADQVFDPTVSFPSTDKAVEATYGSTLWKNGDIFLAQYYAGAQDDPCEPVTGQYAGRMSQWGTQTCAKNSVLWPAIVTTFYPDSTDWNDLKNLLLNPRFESGAMYPWTTKGYASIDRTEGGAYEGDWYGTLTVTQSGKTATLRNEVPYDGTSSTTYREKVHIMCPTSAKGDCTVTMKVIAIPKSGDNVEQNRTVTVSNDGAWHTYKLDTTEMGIDHASVRFSITTNRTVGIDSAKISSDFGGP
jgi:hypothetical protein